VRLRIEKYLENSSVEVEISYIKVMIESDEVEIEGELYCINFTSNNRTISYNINIINCNNLLIENLLPEKEVKALLLNN